MTKSEKPRHSSAAVQKDIRSFNVHADWIRAYYFMYADLYYQESGYLFDAKNRLFYNLLSSLLVRYLLLEFSKVTDPVQTAGEKNLTVDYLVEMIDWPEEVRNILEGLRVRMKEFRDYIKPARNKMLAHLDVGAARSEERYGAFPEGRDKEFVQDLREFCKTMYRSALPYEVPIGHKADMRHFKETLAKSLAFDALYAEADNRLRDRMLGLLRQYPLGET